MLELASELGGNDLNKIVVHADRIEYESWNGMTALAHDALDIEALGRDLIECRRLLQTLADTAESLVGAGISHYGGRTCAASPEPEELAATYRPRMKWAALGSGMGNLLPPPGGGSPVKSLDVVGQSPDGPSRRGLLMTWRSSPPVAAMITQTMIHSPRVNTLSSRCRMWLGCCPWTSTV